MRWTATRRQYGTGSSRRPHARRRHIRPDDGGVVVTPLAKSALEAAAEAFGVEVNAILGQKKKRVLCHARWATWALLSKRGFSSSWIGRQFGVDHTSILHGLRAGPKFADWCASFSSAQDRFKAPECRPVYAVPIGPPLPKRGARRVYATPIGPPPPDPFESAWRKAMAGLAYPTTRVRESVPYREQLCAWATEIS
mgnify:CR=1 FL=1